ncbi:MAG TPA: phage terminase small subunit P27 family [Casimicrobiaceae bacterium]
MIGRPPKSFEQRVVEGGDVSHRPLPEPVSVGGRATEMIEAPAWLAKDAKAYWNRQVPQLVEVGLVDLVDGPVLEILATAYAEWRRATRAINRHGLLLPGSHGGTIINPAVRAQRDAAILIHRYAEQFGLMPLARTRLGLQGIRAQSMQAELDRALADEAVPVDGEVVSDDDDAGLPT